ncbi:MAG: glycoside hydrolase family 2 protein [Mariniphaga sp.]|nr:glycoside hydrolase family 2 protein [Mariniphaga sp.]
MKNLLAVFLIFWVSIANAQKQQQTINQNWQFHQVGKTEWYPANVPGSVHTDLLENKLIPDPYYRDNEKLVQWIETEDWEYNTKFDVEKAVFSKPNIEITFKGLDTYADVYLNDSLILQANNMYRSWTVDCKKLLKPRNNALRILFHSAVNEGLRRAALYTYRLPNHNEKTENDRKSGSQTRKSPHQFGWDTHPRLVSCGLWRPVILTAWTDAKMEDNFIEPQTINAQQASYSIQTNISASTAKDYQLSVFLNNSAKPVTKKTVKLKQGNNSESIALNILNPEFWWPNGMGKSNLYAVKIILSDESGTIDERSVNLGVRTIEVVREKDSIGRSFYFRINGVPLFIKGSNYVPQDALSTRVTNNQYETLIKNAVDANLNMLRVWGGAIYENDEFYNQCDQNGILVWQDFMYACSMYPGDSAFLENIKQETIENVIRLRNHASLALWCGNNELISGWFEWGWPKKPELNISKTDSVEIFQAYQKIFNDIIPGVIAKYNPQTFYWPSSPGSEPRVTSSLTSGDLHYYLVWYGSKSIQDYKKAIPRFMSEYGVQSFPNYSTLKQYLAPEDENLFSPVMMHRQKSVMPWITPDMEGNKMMMRYIREDYNEPKDFQSLVYLSQLFQADAIKIASEAHRLNKPRCMGTMFWQFGDAWPNVGWSVIDYLGKKKAAYYSAKRAFENVLVILALSDTIITPTTLLNVYINSDSTKSFDGKLQLRLNDFNGKILFSKDIPVNVESLSNKVFFTIITNDLLKGFDKNEVLFTTSLERDGKIVSENKLYFNHDKFLKLQKPDIKTKIVQVEGGFEIEFTTNTLAKSVFLSMPNGDDNFSDNFFDLMPVKPVRIKAKTGLSLEQLREQLVVYSLFDSCK